MMQLQKIWCDFLENGAIWCDPNNANQSFVEVTFYGPGEKIFELVKPSNETDLRELGLNERQIAALNYLQENKSFTSSKYSKLFNAANRTARKDLNKLLKKSLIERKGKGKSTRYFLK